MDAYSGKYYLQDGEKQEASVLLLKDRISIGLRDQDGSPRVVYWLYDEVIRSPFWRNEMSVVRCGTYPVQVIEVPTKEFADKLEDIFRQKEKSFFSRTFTSQRLRMIKILSFFLAGLLALYFFLVPFLAERLAGRVPVSYEEELGGAIYNAMQNQFTIDEKRTLYVNEFFRELHIPTRYSIRISVVQADMANAFAIPGGHIVVYDKILNGMDHYEDLAALLSHEFTHVDKKHTTRSLFRQMGSGIFLSVLIGDVGAIGNLIISNANNLKGLSYSRKLEKEADLNGLKLLSERKIDCNGFVRLFKFLEKEAAKSDVQPAEWISSHPDLSRRIDYLKKNEFFNQNGVQENETLKTLFLKIKTAE